MLVAAVIPPRPIPALPATTYPILSYPFSPASQALHSSGHPPSPADRRATPPARAPPPGQVRCCAFSATCALLAATQGDAKHYGAALRSKVAGDPGNVFRHLLEGLQVGCSGEAVPWEDGWTGPQAGQAPW
jgi:hypothetical protein